MTMIAVARFRSDARAAVVREIAANVNREEVVRG